MTDPDPIADVCIFDTTLRDGEQAPGFSMHVGEKLRMARQLDLLGVDVIEAGFPIASEADAEAVSVVAAEIRRPVIAALARCHPKDIDAAGDALRPAARPRIHTFIATSDLHLERKLHITREACLDAAVAAIAQARRYTDDVQFSAEDALRSEMDFLCRVVEQVIAAGATTVNLPDTVGYSTPDEVEAFFRAIRERVPNAARAVFSTHCHDDLGLAVANSLAAVRGGARQVECTVNGIGERAGNASLEEVVMVSRVRADRAGFRTRIVTPEIYPSSTLLSAMTHEPVQANKAIVGRNAFAHEAGIHQDGVLKDRRTYEIMRPEDVGVSRSTLVLGKHSGRHAVGARCQEMGLALDRLALDRVYRRMIALADAQKTVCDDDLASIVAAVRAERPDRPPVELVNRAERRARRVARRSRGASATTTASVRMPASTEPAPAAELGYGHGV
jgi:2-isopropylmalate synthase